VKITLHSLKLRNFKGVKNFELDTQGKDSRIYGNNGTGKTTLADAWHWLLFDKDSRGQSNFEIKTLDDNNQPIHNLEHEVEGTLNVDSKPLSLKKIYYEKWTKKRGSAEKTFEGHTADHFIDEVPVKKSEYDARIAEIIDEDVFKMLTNPGYFNEQLHWEERRKVLLEVSGDVSDEEVIKSDKKLKKLSEVLGERSIEDHKKTVKAKQKKINQELKKIPVRIDEVTQGLPDISSVNIEKINNELSSQRKLKKKKEQSLAQLESGGELAEKKKKLAEIETELIKIEDGHSSKFDHQIEELEGAISEAKKELREFNEDIKDKQWDIKGNKSTIERLEDNKKRLKENWYKLQEEIKELIQQEYRGDTICPTCGQKLPEEQIEEAKANFNRNKAEKIEQLTKEQIEITQKGQGLNREIEGLEKEQKVLGDEIAKLETGKKEVQDQIEKWKAELNDLNEEAGAYQESFQYQKKLTEKKDVEQQIGKLKQSTESSRSAFENNINRFEQNIAQLEKKLAWIDRYETGKKRIAELEEKEKELATKYEKLEGELFMCEEFERTKAEMLENKINSRFKVVNFKLFNQLVNGGLEPCCETLVQGVPYSTNLNNGARINAGIDIINTLSDYYDFYAPIFIDGREGVTEIIDTKSQVISLIVSENDKELRVEVEKDEKKMKEAS